MAKDDIGTLLILGASGDLTGRLLLPGLAGLLASPRGRSLLLLGSGMDEWSDEQWTDRVKESFGTVAAAGPIVEDVVAKTRYYQADVTKAEDLQRLLEQCEGAPAIYFALPPHITAKACAALGELTLPAGTSLVLEKPFGTDQASAVQLNATIEALVPEEQIHRVDHFLGKSTLLNILGLRFANRLFEPLWDNNNVAKIDIVFDESLALEGRAGYYDTAGALVDMIQSHLLQVMAIVGMEAPSTLDATDLRDSKATFLRATRVLGDDPTTASRRARYIAGRVGDRDVPAYVDEEGVKPERMTETLAELTVEVDNWRWSGVPITLRSGKAIGNQRKEAIITFKPVPHLPIGLRGTSQPTRVRIGFGPDRLTVELDVNGPGDPFVLDRCELSADFGAGELLAYGEVLAGVLEDDPTLSVRADTAVECWRIVEPVLDAWKAGTVPMEEYPAGSDGPVGTGWIGTD